MSRSLPPEQAYDLWARTYDQEENNLLLHLDDELTFGANTNWQHQRILDFGCGTGRHWQRLRAFGPDRLVGVDLSAEMLRKLTEKLPGAEVYQIHGERLPMFADGELDIVLCNLTIGYVKDVENLLREWSRVLRSGGQVVVTDLHPAADAKRTFTAGNRSIEIECHRHDLPSLEDSARRWGLEAASLTERRLDEAARLFYERAGALPLYERMKGTPLMYRLSLTKGR